MRFRPLRFARFMGALMAFTATFPLACQRKPQSRPATDHVAATAQASVTDLHGLALGTDHEALDEGLRTALHQFRDRFACNSISGCPSEAVLVGFGWEARPYVEQVFATASVQASYRARAVKVLARLADPRSLPLFDHLLADRDPETRGYAVYGIGRLDARAYRARLRTLAGAGESAWDGGPRLSAWWALHRFGDPDAAAAFTTSMGYLASQSMAGPALTWGLELCSEAGGPDCRAALPAIARHPAFTVRRALCQLLAGAPRLQDAGVLVDLAGDPAHTISRRAEEGLVALSGNADVHGQTAWRDWCRSAGCGAMSLK